MGKYSIRTVVLILCIAITGCTAMFVPATSDPAKKLSYACQLVQYLGRPLPAEGLIWDAIEIYTKDQNEKGLMEAYWMYGIFFSIKSCRGFAEDLRAKGIS